MTQNFLSETDEELAEINKTWNDIVFIGSSDCAYSCSVEQFRKLADFDYHSGYGSAEIPESLVILFNDNTWLSRGEYDGSEWWNYNKPPQIPIPGQEIKTIETLRIINWGPEYVLPSKDQG